MLAGLRMSTVDSVSSQRCTLTICWLPRAQWTCCHELKSSWAACSRWKTWAKEVCDWVLILIKIAHTGLSRQASLGTLPESSSDLACLQLFCVVFHWKLTWISWPALMMVTPKNRIAKRLVVWCTQCLGRFQIRQFWLVFFQICEDIVLNALAKSSECFEIFRKQL